MCSFADRLKEEIEYLGLTRNELALRAKIKKRALDMYLGTQESMPPADVAVRLAKALNVTVEYLVTGKNESYQDNKSVNQSENFSMISDYEKLNTANKKTVAIIIRALANEE